MKALRFLVLMAALGTTDCRDADQQRVDQQAVTQSGVAPAVYEKMERRAPLNVDDVIALSQAHVQDRVLKRYIDARGTIYHLTTADADRLHRGGVTYDLIRYMGDTVTGHWPYPKAGHYLAPFGEGI
jgi:hypothetical protein